MNMIAAATESIDPTSIHQVIDHAAQQGMGWWGAAALILFVLGGVWLLRDNREANKELLEDLKSSNHQQVELLMGVIVDNTKVNEKSSEAVLRLAIEVHEMRTVIMKCPGASSVLKKQTQILPGHPTHEAED